MSAADVQALLRFLSQDAKVPLATAMAKVRDLQAAHLDSAESISKVKAADLSAFFPDEKIAKQVLNAAKRINKKRSAGDTSAPLPVTKRKRKDPFEVQDSVVPEEFERSLDFDSSDLSAEELQDKVFITNRAPLVLAFAATLAKYTLPGQPPSSRLSLAQAVVSLGSQSKAKYIGLKKGPTAEDEGWAEGQPTVQLMGRKISVLKRWGYEWTPSPDSVKTEGEQEANVKSEVVVKPEELNDQAAALGDAPDAPPALWAIDLDKLKDLNGPVTFQVTSSSGTSGLPVYSPQSARDYVYRSFDTPPVTTDSKTTKKKSASEGAAGRRANVGCLITALDLLFSSWSKVLTTDDLDKRSWSWYVNVRPEVEHGVAGWGAKGELKLKDILDLRRPG